MQDDSKIQLVINSRERDLGGFSVRRLLPHPSHRMVGPFIFFDHMGPAEMIAGDAMNVRPHPHINLATVTYLFEGKITHRDCLGSHQDIEPGDINWMTAGRGIVHSERSPESEVQKTRRMNGIQLWVALPKEHEETSPTFFHHPKTSLPEFKIGEVKCKVLLGEALGQKSPVQIFSDLFYVECLMPRGAHFDFKNDGREHAFYVVNGEVQSDGREFGEFSMVIVKPNEDVSLVAQVDSRVMLLGGSSLGPRFIYWNFVSSQESRIEEAKKDWANGGPRATSARFKAIPDDDKDYIPLPAEPPVQAKA